MVEQELEQCRFTIFCKILLSEAVSRRCSIKKMFLKKVLKFTEENLVQDFLFDKVPGRRLKTGSSAGLFL